MLTAGLFDELYDRYDKWFESNTITAENEARLVKVMAEGAPRPIVEVGVGTGYFASKIGAEAGLDPSPRMMSIARMRGVELLVEGVGERMPFRDSSFGTVLIVVTLCFVDDPVQTLRESHRVLRSGGNIIACVIPRDSSWGKYYVELGAGGHPFYSKARFYKLEELLDMLEHVGFKIVDIMGTLGYTPEEEPRVEEPSRDTRDKSFVCVKAVKA
ncbi:MAG: class I SAM-dependent methyltransferase [Thermoanaerobaculaceae bacterium]